MKAVVHLCLESLDNRWGGIATAVHLLAQTTADSEISTTVVSAEVGARSGLDISGYRHVIAAVPRLGVHSFYEAPDRLGLGEMACVALLGAARSLHCSDEVDLIVHNEELASIVEQARSERWVRTVSVVSHGLMAYEHPDRPELQEAQRQELRSADVVFAVSRSQVEELRSHFCELSTVRYLPLPLSRLVQGRGRSLPKEGQFAAVGRSVRQKGFDLLLKAYGDLDVDRPVSLDLALGHGEESYERECRELVAAASNPVQLHRWLGRGSVLRLLGSSAAVIVPSRFEPLGLVAAEAMSLGRPVVASAVGGLPELISSPDLGILIPVSDRQGPQPEDLRLALKTVLERGLKPTGGPDVLMEKYDENATLAVIAKELGW